MSFEEIRAALETLCQVTAPSGFEDRAVRTAAALLKPYVDEVSIDRMGNVVGVKRCGVPGAPRLLLDAHLDEIGLVVTGVEEGFLRFRAIGGVDQRMLPDREVTVLTDPPRFGVVACLPPHVQSAQDTDKSVDLDDLVVDVGLSQEEAAAQIPVGTPISYRCGCFPLGERRVCGKSMDDRACFVSLLVCAQALREVPMDVDVYYVGSVREEVGGYGAACAGYGLDPRWCVAVDVTHASTPDEPASKGRACELGAGPAVTVSPRVPRWMSRRLLERGEALGIPCQVEVSPSASGTNGDDYQIVREGIATAVVSLPERYMHTPVEVLDLGDLERLGQLLAGFAQGLREEAPGC